MLYVWDPGKGLRFSIFILLFLGELCMDRSYPSLPLLLDPRPPPPNLLILGIGVVHLSFVPDWLGGSLGSEGVRVA